MKSSSAGFFVLKCYATKSTKIYVYPLLIGTYGMRNGYFELLNEMEHWWSFFATSTLKEIERWRPMLTDMAAFRVCKSSRFSRLFCETHPI